MLSRVCDLQKEIATFLRQKNLPYADHFVDPLWLTRPADRRHYTPERPQCEAAGQRHAHNRHARTHHRLRCKVAIVGGAIGCQLEHFPRLAARVPDDVEPATCVSVVASLREEFASRFAGVRPLAADFKLFTAGPL